MSDEQVQTLMHRAAEGDSEAQEVVDKWIADALGALCATPPMGGERIVERMAYDEMSVCPECSGVCEF